MENIVDKYLFFGMGYSSTQSARFVRKHARDELEIYGSVRSQEVCKKLEFENIKSYIFTGLKANAELNQPIAQASHIINSIAPDANGDAVYNYYFEQLNKAKNLKWLCYYSTVGVYGNHNGLWVDENSKCEPKNIRSQQRIKAENLWQDFAEQKNIPLLILRLAGIYGQGRSSFEKLKKGTAKRIIKENQVFNRIHVKDIARVTMLAAKQKLNGIFNLSDDEPAPPHEVVEYACKISGLDLPPKEKFEDANMSEMARSFYNDNKHVSNKAIKNALNIELLYPNYRTGLNSILQQEEF